MAPNTVLQPPGWPRPQGFAYGMRARGDMVFVGGMIGQDENGRFAEGFVAQTKQALANIAAVLAQAGGSPRHIVRLTWYVRDVDEYLGELAALRPGRIRVGAGRMDRDKGATAICQIAVFKPDGTFYKGSR